MKNIYNLDLFEETFAESDQHDPRSFSVRRVPGGWICTEFEESRQESNDVHVRLSSVFVPYSDEFKGDKKIGGF
jgi:hypothetical protein